MANRIAGAVKFFRHGIWQRRLADERGVRRLVLKYLRVLILAVNRFNKDECSVRASALTFYALLSVVPVVALIFGIAKGFGFDQTVRRQFMSQQGWQASVSAMIVNFAGTFLEQARGGIIAGVGVAVLLWVVVSLLENIEKSFNVIWEVQESRAIFRQFTDYLSMMLVGTILMIIAAGMTITAAGEVKSLGVHLPLLGTVTPFLMVLLKVMPYAIIGGLFSFVYFFMPNTGVRVSAAVTGGLIAGTVFQLVQWAYIKFQIGVSSYGAVYGSFAALPLFLAWLQLSWMIVLFGAEVSFVSINAETYGYRPEYEKISDRVQMLMLLRMMHYIVRCFKDGRCMPAADEMAGELQIPLRFVQRGINRLVEAGLVAASRVPGKGLEGYQPRCDSDGITIGSVIAAVESAGFDDIVPVSGPAATGAEKIEHILDDFGKTLLASESNRRLRDI